jgi:hypothetical protein
VSRPPRSKGKRALTKAEIADLIEASAPLQEHGYTLEHIALLLTDPGPPNRLPVVGGCLSPSRRFEWDPRALSDPWDEDGGDPFGPAHET